MAAKKRVTPLDISKVKEEGRRRSRSLSGFSSGRFSELAFDLENPAFEQNQEKQLERPLSERNSEDKRKLSERLKRKKYDDARNQLLNSDSLNLDYPSLEDEKSWNNSATDTPGYVSNSAAGYSTSGIQRRMTRRKSKISASFQTGKYSKNLVVEYRCNKLPPDTRFRRRAASAHCGGLFSKREPEFKSIKNKKVSLKDLPLLSDSENFYPISCENDYVEGGLRMSGHDCLFRSVSFCLMCLNPIFSMSVWENVGRGEHLKIAKGCRKMIMEEASGYSSSKEAFVDEAKVGSVFKDWYAGKGHADLPSSILKRFFDYANGVGDMYYEEEDHVSILQAVATKYKVCVTLLYMEDEERHEKVQTLPAGIGAVRVIFPKNRRTTSGLDRISIFYDFEHFYPIRPKGNVGGRRLASREDKTPRTCKVISATEAERKAKELIEMYPFEIVSFNINEMSTLTCGKFERSSFSNKVYICPTLGIYRGEDKAETHFYTVRRTRADIPDNSSWNKELHKMYVIVLNRRRQYRTTAYLDVFEGEKLLKNREKTGASVLDYKDSTRFQLVSPMRLLVLVCSTCLELAELKVFENKDALKTSLDSFHERARKRRENQES
jgi:hypothetical protein